MRLMFALAIVTLAACHDDHGHTFDTYPDCVDEHTDEGLTEAQSVAHCLVDYPEFSDGLDDQAECEAYVTDQGYPDSAEEGCTTFFEETGQ